MPRKPPISERTFITNLASRSATKSPYLKLGIGDDCALLRPPKNHEIAITTDFSLENRHFRRNAHPPEAIGHRTLARGLSDLAAMSAKPLAAFLSLALPAEVLQSNWPNRYLDGLLALAAKYKVPLAGGDTAESPNDLILADIILIGALPTNRALLRSGAKPGDNLYVTGSLGGAAAELAQLLRHPKRFAAQTKDSPNHPHLYPQPRLVVGQYLLRPTPFGRSLATSCIDLSDGLSTDLAHLCQASGVAAEVQMAALPIATSASPLECLGGGEDYELLFTASPPTRMPSIICGVPITQIGKIKKRAKNQPPCILINHDGSRQPLYNQGFEHFKR